MNLENYYVFKEELKKDELLYGHCSRVSNLACKIAKKLNFSEKDIKKVKIGGMLHDIGKLQIPKEILYKQEKLTDNEFEKIKQHPIYGFNMLNDIKSIEDVVAFDSNIQAYKTINIDKEVLDMVLFHHRYFDGYGYPKEGINNFPHMTQIITICDCFDAMCDQTRTYKKSLTVGEAILELKKNSGSQFNPIYVDTLISILKD